MINEIKKIVPFLINKKISYLLSMFLMFACANEDVSRYGKIVPYDDSSGNDKRFVFYVEEEYIIAHKNSKKDDKNPIMTKAETFLLEKILRNKKQCIDQNNKILSYKITSKQEKIYDVTFANLIEQNYNARPASPLMYYGLCL